MLHAASKCSIQTERTNQQPALALDRSLSPTITVYDRDSANFINVPATPSPFSNKVSYSPHKLKQKITQRHHSSSKVMHFLLLGASGRTGQHVVTELLSQGHTAVALVRTSSSLTPRPGLTIVTGSPLSKSDIRSALLAAPPNSPPMSAAIITLNTLRKSDSPFAAQISPPRFLADSCANVCEVLEKDAGCSRVVVMSTAGVGDSWGNLPLLSKAFLGWTNVKYALEDHGLVDEEIRLTGMDWTLVRAVRLRFDDDRKEMDTKRDVRTLGSKGDGMGLTDSVGVAGVATFLVKVAVERLFVRSAVVVAD
ncbi:hypothetical protein MMC25_000972 [Agyrium rufum]|nr:hypothetical protein [Agyrium rufum]